MNQSDPQTGATRYYSVDRRGFYKSGDRLKLFQTDPYSRILYGFQGSFQSEDVEAHLRELFPEGMSLHGWKWMATRNDIVTANENGLSYVRYEMAIELVFEYVRRAFFPVAPSRMQSYFAFESLEATKAFAPAGKPIYQLTADVTYPADQEWLRLGVQGAMGAYCAHQYWSQKPTGSPKWEVLLLAPVNVLGQQA